MSKAIYLIIMLILFGCGPTKEDFIRDHVACRQETDMVMKETRGDGMHPETKRLMLIGVCLDRKGYTIKKIKGFMD